MNPQAPPQSRRRGRPRRKTPALPVCVRLSAPVHDALIRLAMTRGISVSAAIRRAIVRELLYLKNSRTAQECYVADAALAAAAPIVESQARGK
jgi:post-segregation antitoxin (ccd killing protein)